MIENYKIEIVIEHGDIHYKIIDTRYGSEIHCDIDELWDTINELLREDEALVV